MTEFGNGSKAVLGQEKSFESFISAEVIQALFVRLFR